MPALAQEQNTVDPEVRQQIEAAYMKFAEAFNKHDAAAMGDLYTQNAVEVWPSQPDGGLISGREPIVKAIMAEAVLGSTLEHKIVQIYACGNDICAITEWDQVRVPSPRWRPRISGAIGWRNSINWPKRMG
jgi:ketosteroid isomerase-like protein